MNDKELMKIAAEDMTPAYIFDTDILQKRIDLLRNAFDNRVKLCYAMKANPFLVDPMQKMVDKFEVCSPGEFRICERTHIPMDHIVLSGVYKETKEVEHVVETYHGAGVLTVESWSHLEKIAAAAEKNQTHVSVLLRLTSGNQFGLDEKDIYTIIGNRAQYEYVEFLGLQYYSGTQKKKISQIQDELTMLDHLYTDLAQKEGFVAKELEYGPGFYVPYFTNEDNHEEAVVAEFADMLKKLNFQGEITLEMGRFMAADCGCYISKIVDQKVNHDVNYCIIDGGINHVNYYGQMMAMRVPDILHISQNDSGDDAEKTWCICGSLCTVGDVLVKQLPLTNAQVGDKLVFKRIGAYSITEGIYLFLSRDMPGVYLYSQDKGLELLRSKRATDIINSKE